MKPPASTLLALLTVVAAGVGVASAQFTTSATTRAVGADNAGVTRLGAARGNVRTVVHTTIARMVRPPGSRADAGPGSAPSVEGDGGEEGDEKMTTMTTIPRSPIPILSSAATTTTISQSQSQSQSIAASNSPQADTLTVARSPATEDDKPSSGGLSAGAAAGLTAGAAAGVALVAMLGFLVWRRRQGGIRGAVVAADYPPGMDVGMYMDVDGSEPKFPCSSTGTQVDLIGEKGGGIGITVSIGKDDPFYPSPDTAADINMDSPGAGATEARGIHPPISMILPPAGTMPGEPEFPEYLVPVNNDEYGDVEAVRPVSALTADPSPPQPAMPVSPQTPHAYPDQHSAAAQGPATTRTTLTVEEILRPDLPTYMIPGGDRSRVLRFASRSHG